jgi:hypothetical protein
MRYLLAAHGCYHDKEKVSLRGIDLEFYSEQNECVRYTSQYIHSFCRESTHKDNVYKPVFVAKKNYYEMSFNREYGDKVPSFISCCTTGEIIYDFKDGDLTLSEVLDIIRIHADFNYPKYILPKLSILACNAACYTSDETTNIILHRRKSFNEQNRTNQNLTLRQSRYNSSQKRKRNMNRLGYIAKKRRHFLKPGDNVVSKATGNITPVENMPREELKKIRRDPDLFWLPRLKVGDQVMHESTLWIIEDISKGHFAYCTIRNIKTGKEARVKSVFLIKVNIRLSKMSRDRSNRYFP